MSNLKHIGKARGKVTDLSPLILKFFKRLVLRAEK
jgi:hypothetical protein